jgi:hypothetical protein
MQSVERAAKGPGEYKLNVTSNRPIGSEVVGAFEAPIGNDFPTVIPKEMEMNVVEGFVDTHEAGRGGSMEDREDVAAEC